MRNHQRPHLGTHVPRDDFDHLPGLLAAQKRLSMTHGEIFPAFEGLDIRGLSVDALLDYIERPLKSAGMEEKEYGRVVGVILGTVMIAVEADREARMDP